MLIGSKNLGKRIRIASARAYRKYSGCVKNCFGVRLYHKFELTFWGRSSCVCRDSTHFGTVHDPRIRIPNQIGLGKRGRGRFRAKSAKVVRCKGGVGTVSARNKCTSQN